MRLVPLLVLLAACGGSTAPAPAPVAPPPMTNAPPPDAAPRDVTYYDRGRVVPGGGDHFYECIGTDAARDACAAMIPNAHCVLDTPPGYWPTLPCRGAKIEDWELEEHRRTLDATPVPACDCTCDPAYMEAYEREQARRDACGDPP
jgi:hypothetical protein